MLYLTLVKLECSTFQTQDDKYMKCSKKRLNHWFYSNLLFEADGRTINICIILENVTKVVFRLQADIEIVMNLNDLSDLLHFKNS